MEAVTALGVAAAAVQFVDFGTNILSKARELHNSVNGALLENAEIEVASKRLTDMVTTLQTGSCTPGGSGGKKITPSDQILKEICQGCLSVSNELIPRLEKLKVANESRTKWKSFRQALKTVWSKESIREIRERLVAYQGQLDTHTLLFLKEKVGNQDTRIESIDESLRRIFATISEAELEDRLRNLRLNQIQGETHLENRQILEGIRAQFLSLNSSQRSEHINTRKRIRDEFEASRQFQEMEHKKTRRILSSQSQQQADQSLIRNVQLSILQSLRFETMDFRHDAIEEEHERTFEWLFDEPSEDKKSKHNGSSEHNEPGEDSDPREDTEPIEDNGSSKHAKYRPWSNFPEWLRSGSGIYWVSGKAGSGKSTLMKFIVDHPKTKAQLTGWSRGAPVEFPGFFFWNSGNLDQRSQQGLFRSLLWYILKRHPHLMPVVLRAEWEEQLEHAGHGIPMGDTHAKWTLSRLKKCFKALLAQSSEQLRFCFFIDGLDEYDGEHFEIAEFFSSISSSPFVKLCISSRPLPVFRTAFSDLPQLQLQDLTHNDIWNYVYDKLNDNKCMRSLAEEDLLGYNDLISQIISKADGVFLWVTIAVTSLLRGLTHKDSIQFLEMRLYEIPETLEGVYDRMLTSIEPIYRERGSRIFKTMFTLEKEDKILNTPIFYFAHAFDLRAAFSDLRMTRVAVPQAIQPDWLKPEYYEDIKSIVATSCGGLLETSHADIIHYNSINSEIWREFIPVTNRELPRSLNVPIKWLHRTARDYLRNPKVWEKFLSRIKYLPGDLFDPYLVMAIANISETNTLWPVSNKNRLLGKYLLRQYESLTYHISLTDPNSTAVPVLVQVLEEFDRVATDAFDLARSQGNLEASQIHWSNHGLNAIWKTNLLSTQLRQASTWYLKWKVQDHSWINMMKGADSPLLAHCFILCAFGSSVEGLLENMGILIDNGWHPSETYEGFTIWEYWVYFIYKSREYRFAASNSNALQEVTSKMLLSGVDLRVKPIRSSQIWNRLFPGAKKVRIIYMIHTIFQFRKIELAWTMDDQATLESYAKPRSENYHDNDAIQPGEEDFLVAAIKGCFQTNRSPHGADRLLQLVDELRARG